MNPDAEHLELLSDAVDRVIASPGASHCWENLMELTRGIRHIEVLNKLIQLLHTGVPDTGLPGFHRALYLDLSSGEPQHLADAARLLLDITPVDSDRFARFHYFAWQRVLMRTLSGNDLTAQLIQAGLPAIAERLGTNLARITPGLLQPRPVNGLERVAVVAPYLISEQHPPTTMALDQCRVLAEQGLQVELFTCQEPSGPGFEHLLANGSGAEQPTADLRNWAAAYPNAPRHIHLADNRFSLLRRGVAILDRIASFDPDLVFFVGPQSALLQSLHAARPVVGLCVNSIPPMVPVDAFLTTHQAWHRQEQQPWGTAMPAGLAWHHPWRVWGKSPANPLSRSALQLDQGQVVLVTVGHILNTRITGGWAAAMVTALQRHPQLVWTIVGDEGQVPTALADVPADRLRLLPHSNDVPALLACGDIYAHPPIAGGGFAVAEAMSQGLAVLALAGADGGDKLGAAALADEAAYFAQLDAWVHDRAARQACGQRNRQHFHDALDLAQSGPSLMAACGAALERYRQRTGLTTQAGHA